MNSTNLKSILHDCLKFLDCYTDSECVILDYPDYINLEDHLISLDSILYLTNVLNLKISYATSREQFSATKMQKIKNNCPIFINGGGNLGDLWVDIQQFKENIIKQYNQHPIIILPQSIYFREKSNLEKTAKIFNQHPDLTIFVRDNYSYNIALEAFDKCKVFKSPDMALEMINCFEILSQKQLQQDTILYLYRNDRELNKDFSPNQLNLSNLIVEDWLSFAWKLGVKKGKIGRSLINVYREGWQRGLKTPQEWLARQQWLISHPYTNIFRSANYSNLHLQSWSFIHNAMYQFQPHKLIISNRLHGHILCILLEKPHIFLPNAYHKNEQFYQTWTSNIDFCKFVKDPKQIQAAILELI